MLYRFSTSGKKRTFVQPCTLDTLLWESGLARIHLWKQAAGACTSRSWSQCWTSFCSYQMGRKCASMPSTSVCFNQPGFLLLFSGLLHIGQRMAVLLCSCEFIVVCLLCRCCLCITWRIDILPLVHLHYGLLLS